ncbi:MAG TPA: S24 family peptidase [Clostridiales bacterium]|nr:S24 family peptidase [Clostridiales bacterium]
MDTFQKEVYVKLINRAIGERGVTHFAKEASLSAGNLSRIRKGQLATVETLKKIAAAADGVSFAELMDAAGYTESAFLKAADPMAVPTTSQVISIPVVEALRGTKKEIKQDDSLKKEYYYADAFGSGDFIFFVVNDDAFAPKVNCGDKVLIDMAKKPTEGEIALFLLNGEETMLRHLTRQGKKYYYYGNDLGKYPMTEVNTADIKIYGTAVRAFVTM